VLFLYRPRQTWMPYRRPRAPAQQDAYNRHLQESFAATRRVPQSVPAPEGSSAAPVRDPIADLRDLGQLHDSGVLSDAEFAAAKAKVLGTGPPAS
jgi:hypothetical protein